MPLTLSPSLVRALRIGALALILPALFLVTGCSTPRPKQPPFPLGIYSVPKTADFSAIRQAGFNTIVGPATKDYLDKAHSAGLKVLAHPPAAPQVRRADIRALDSHPALWAWYLIDEPDLNLVSPAEVRRRNANLKKLGIRKPSALTLFQGYEAFDYGDIADILMIDRYPVPWLPLANFGQHIKMGRLSVGPDKPLIAIVQAFDWSICRDLLGTDVPLRPPTYAEMRCMAFEALARGANGIFFYEFDEKWKLQDHPELWESLKRVSGEIRDLEPLFLGKRLWWPKQHAFTDRALAYNAALESSVSSTLLIVPSGSPAVPSGCYILAVNNTPAELEYSFALPSEVSSSILPVLQEDRTLSASSNRVTDKFAPYAVHIYGPIPLSAESKSIRNKR